MLSCLEQADIDALIRQSIAMFKSPEEQPAESNHDTLLEGVLGVVHNLLIESAFASWMELGNADPNDWSGMDGKEAENLRHMMSGGDSPAETKTGRLPYSAGRLHFEEAECYHRIFLRLREMERLCEEGLFLEDLCRLSFLGCIRARRLLAGVIPLLFGEISEVPGLDESRSHLEAAKFFFECGWREDATKALFRKTWGAPDAYLVGGRILLLENMTAMAEEAFRVGAGLGDGGCAGYLASLSGGHGTSSQRRFRAVQLAAERGFPLPLMEAGRALLDGDGIDSDAELAHVYLFLAGRSKSDGEGEWRGLGYNGVKIPVRPSAYYGEIIFSWAGKHPTDPIFTAAAKIWRDRLKA